MNKRALKEKNCEFFFDRAMLLWCEYLKLKKKVSKALYEENNKVSIARGLFSKFIQSDHYYETALAFSTESI